MQDKNKITGSGNNLIARDLNITISDLDNIYQKDISIIVKSKINGIDEFINKIIPDGILLSKNPNKETRESFNSEKILKSLGLLGVTLTAALAVVSETVQLIDRAVQQNTDMSTRLVRGYITESLYGLDETIFSRSIIESWGDKYIRRYGSETEVKVVNVDGKEETLKHDFLRNNIIPVVVADITRNAGPQIAEFKILSHKALTKMATEIFETLASLNLYRINYETICNITKELFTQPPHPWLAPKVRSYEHVNYDFGRAISNFKKAKRYKSLGNVPKCKYALKEFAHHSCSSILCYYSIYMGCGTLAPLHILNCSIDAILKKDNEKLALLFKLDEIKGDLSKQKVSIGNFQHTLKKIIALLHDPKAPTPFYIETLYIECENLHNIILTLITPFLRLKKIERIGNYQSPLTSRSIKYLLNDLFMLFPGLEWEHHKQNESYWVFHSYDVSIFKQIKESILLVTLQNKQIKINSYISNWLMISDKYKLTCNTIFFLYDINHINISELPLLENNDKFIVFFSYQQLIETIKKQNPIKEVEKAIRAQVHKN